jgi:predicted PurR-regulated permease PerM
MSPEVPIIVLILAIPTYFICKWLMTRLKVGNKRNRKFLAIIPTVILSPLIYVGLVMIWIFSISYYPTSDFDKNEWNSNVEERFKMSENIIESEILIGKTREEVIQMLGNDFITNNESEITYELGNVPGLFNIDPDYLDIKLKNGKVISVDQYEG